MEKRLFTVLTGIAVLMILIAGSGVYLTNKVVVANAKEAAAQSSAKGVAQVITQQIELLGQILDKMAKDPEVIAAAADNKSTDLVSVASRLEQYYPIAGKIRLLPIGTIEVDQTNIPRMGFGDIDMVKATFQDNPLPAIQGDVGPDRHLAMTRRIMQGKQAVGIILASVSFDFLNRSLQDEIVENSYMEIRQGKLALFTAGNKADIDEADLSKLNITATSWDLLYSTSGGGSIGQFLIIFCFIAIPAFLTSFVFFMAQRHFSETLAQDLDWIFQAFKDVLVNRPKGSYPVSLTGMNTLISSMVRFNREVEIQEADEAKKSALDFELDGYFDENENTTKALPKTNVAVKKPLEIPPAEKKTEPVETIKIEPVVLPSTMDVTEEPEQTILPVDPKAAIFRAYDIRGIVGKTLTEEIVYDVGRALASEAKELGSHTVVIGRDGRTSSPILANALAKGIASTGCNVLDIGMVPTPVLYFVVQHTDGRTGVMVTGSHNPAEYNGLKMIIKGETLAGNRIQQLKQRIDNQTFSTGNGSIEQNGMFESEYIGTLCEDVQVTRAMKVVLDCGNGVAGDLAPLLFKTLGCEVIELYCTVDGSFPNHHPDPSKPENLAELIKTVKENNADLGLAFDGDGDRLGVVDSSGNIIWPDRQMMLFAKDVLAGKPGSEIIYDVKCSRHLPDQIVKFGGKPLMGKTGHSYMKAKIKETGARLAGEMSGHIFFNDRWYGFDDALYAGARLMQILSEDERTSAEIFAKFPDSLNTPELNVELAEGENVKFIEKMFASANFSGGKVTDIDGMRIDFFDGWGLVRASNTTPSLVIRFEADTKAAMEKIQNQFRELMLSVKPDIKLPF